MAKLQKNVEKETANSQPYNDSKEMYALLFLSNFKIQIIKKIERVALLVLTDRDNSNNLNKYKNLHSVIIQNSIAKIRNK